MSTPNTIGEVPMVAELAYRGLEDLIARGYSVEVFRVAGRRPEYTAIAAARGS